MKIRIKRRFPFVSVKPDPVVDTTFLYGREFLAEYREKVEREFGNNPHLNAFSLVGEEVRGCNIPSLVLANEILTRRGLSLVTQAHLEDASRRGVLELKGTVVDTGLVLYLFNTPNLVDEKLKIKNSIERQLRDYGASTLAHPEVVNLADLTLVRDSQFESGFAYRVKPSVRVVPAKILCSHTSYNSSSGNGYNVKDIDEDTGLPRKLTPLRGADRELFTRNNWVYADGYGGTGLARLSFSEGHKLYASRDDLNTVYPNGKIITVRK